VFYAQPNYANPTGAQWPAALHGQVLDVRTPRRNLREQLRVRRDLLVSFLREHAPQADIRLVPTGGLEPVGASAGWT